MIGHYPSQVRNVDACFWIYANVQINTQQFLKKGTDEFTYRYWSEKGREYGAITRIRFHDKFLKKYILSLFCIEFIIVFNTYWKQVELYGHER